MSIYHLQALFNLGSKARYRSRHAITILCEIAASQAPLAEAISSYDALREEQPWNSHLVT